MLNRKGQNIAEYSILIALVVAAAVAMQTYVKRGLQGKVKDVVDHKGAAVDVGGANLSFSGTQFEPDYIDNTLAKGTDRNVTETASARGGVVRTITQDKETKTGTEKITYGAQPAPAPSPAPETPPSE